MNLMLKTFQGRFSQELHISTGITKPCQIALCLGNTNYWRHPERKNWRFSCLSFLSFNLKLCPPGSLVCCSNGQILERKRNIQRQRRKLN